MRQMLSRPWTKRKMRRGVDVVAQGDAVGLHESLGSLNVVPGSLLGEEVGKKELAAEVVDGGDEGPFLLGLGTP